MASERDGQKRRGGWMGCAVACLTALGLSAAAIGQCWEGEFIGNDSQWGDMFGWSVDLSADGGTAIVGAPLANSRGNADGAAYVFERLDGVWTQTARLFPSDAHGKYHVGAAVALHPGGREAVVTSSDEFIHHFRHVGGGWTDTVLFAGSLDWLNSDAMIAEDGQTLVVGGGNGAVYIFGRDGESWRHLQTLTGEGHFGRTIAVSRDAAVIAVGEHHGALVPGSVSTYLRDGNQWTFETRFTDLLALQYGAAIALTADGQRLIFRLELPPGHHGTVLVYDRTLHHWILSQTIELDVYWSNHTFGNSLVVSPDGGTLLIGDSSDESIIKDAGALYIYQMGAEGYELLSTHTPADAAPIDGFSTRMSLAQDGQRLVISSPFGEMDVPVTLGSGVAYVMNLNECAPDFASMGDLDGDNDIDDFDLGILLNAYEKTAEGDLDGDDDTDQHDLGILLKHYGQML